MVMMVRLGYNFNFYFFTFNFSNMRNRLVTLFLLLSPVISNAQSSTGDGIMETETPRALVELENVAFRIDGVSGSAFNIKLFPTDSVDFTVIMHFYSRQNDSTFVLIPQSSMNADWHDFKLAALALAPVGTPDSDVNSQVQLLMKAMIAGNMQEKFDAYNLIMTGYGAPLKAAFE
jgi:hypothetical protein